MNEELVYTKSHHIKITHPKNLVMKKALKITGIILLGLIALVLIFVGYIAMSGIPSYEVEDIKYTANSSPESIERGHKLSMMLCANCHINRETGKLTGAKMLDAPPEFGEIFSPNITQHKVHGIGEWTDGDLVRLLRTGIKKDGQYAPVYMAKLPLMADEDINAIISFLRSDHQMVQADPTVSIPPEPSLLTKFLCRVAWKPYPLPSRPIELPDSANTLKLGEYLVHNLDCYACHSADFKTIDALNPPASVGYFGGGNLLLDREGRTKLSSNITPDKETGIGSWSKEKFIKAVKYGTKEGEAALTYPMLPYSMLTDHEVEAMYEYLQTVPPIANKVERSIYD